MSIYFDLFWIFFGMSLISFGGVYGLLPELQRIIVNERHWMTADQFFQSFVIAQFVPGPNVVMCVLIGFRVSGLLGAISAGMGIFLGPVLVMALGCKLYYQHRERQWVRRIESALRPLVFALMLSSSGVLLWQQLGSHRSLGLALGSPIVWLDWNRKLGAFQCIFLFGMLWSTCCALGVG